MTTYGLCLIKLQDILVRSAGFQSYKTDIPKLFRLDKLQRVSNHISNKIDII